jgi:hypothetical protein
LYFLLSIFIIIIGFIARTGELPMRQFRSFYLILSAAVLIAALALMTLPTQSDVFAQAPAADTPTTQPPTETPTATTVPPTATDVPDPGDPPTATPTFTNTAEPPETDEPTSTPVPPAAPVAIPEPITVVLFGTGLAALSAAAARRKKENDKGDKQ